LILKLHRNQELSTYIDTSKNMVLKVLELFSGIGGMRCGITEALGNESEVEFVAVDLNEVCNRVYEESFGDKPLTIDITSLSESWFENIQADIWTMSPPCQPYSRQGNMRGSADDRSRPFHHLIAVLGHMQKLPKMILLENVKNFEISDSFHEFKSVLEARGYQLHGYLLNPLYMGFPNSRLRFFLVGILGGSQVPIVIKCNDRSCNGEFEFLDTETMYKHRVVADFLCGSHNQAESRELMIPSSILTKKAAFAFDIVAPKSRQCLCFTKSYRKYINGTGSVLFEGNEAVVSSWDQQERPMFQIESSMLELEGCLRFFCPLEAARLNGFRVNDETGPCSLKFSDGCKGRIHYYRAIGNSLNPHIVAFLVSRHSK
jgi:tRNA (cytosine38-C5)-methyltransferase